MKEVRNIIIFCFLTVLGTVAALAQTPTRTTAQNSIASATPQTNGLGVKDDRYLIGYQDVVEIQVFRHPELSSRYSVSANGTIILFRLDHPVVAVCKTPGELATDVENAYKEKYLRDPQVNVVVAEQKSQAVMVIGAVVHPGPFYLTHRVHLLEALATAGGPNKESGTRMLVARSGSTSNCKSNETQSDDNTNVALLDFKIRDVQEGKAILWMQPGDVVSVLDADVVYVYGNVNKQGSITVHDPITLTQAIASSEGLKPATKKDHVRILRQKPGALDREELVFNLNDIDKGKVKDPYLEPGDIVAVSEDRASKIMLGITNTIKTSVPNVLYRLP